MLIYSKYDISCALQRQASVACSGYLSEDAVKIAVNVILYALLRTSLHRPRAPLRLCLRLANAATSVLNPDHTLSRVLGHSKPSITLDICAHVLSSLRGLKTGQRYSTPASLKNASQIGRCSFEIEHAYRNVNGRPTVYLEYPGQPGRRGPRNVTSTAGRLGRKLPAKSSLSVPTNQRHSVNGREIVCFGSTTVTIPS